MPSDWTKTPDGQWWRAEGELLLPVDPRGVAVVMLRSKNGIGVGFSAVEKGDPGVPANFDTVVNHTSLAYDDPTPESASLTVITPPTTTTPGVWRVNLATRRGQPGEDGESVWDPTDLSENPVAGQIPVVDGAATGFELVAQKIPEVFYPGAINNTGSGNVNSSLAQIAIPSRPWPRRIRGLGYTVVTGEADDVRVDLLARLNGESGGNIVGRCQGITRTERLTMSPGKPIETGTAADAYDMLAANTAGIVYIKCERQAGSVTYTTSASTSQFSVEALPL